MMSPFWIKLGLCPPKFDRRDLMHAVGSLFGGILRFEEKGDFCRICVNLNVHKPLRWGVIIIGELNEKYWLSFKYEHLPSFCFWYG